MTLTQLQEMILEASKIDITRLDYDSIQTPYTYGKFITIHATEKAHLTVHKKAMITLRKKKTDYYRNDGTPEEYKEKPLHQTVLKSQVSSYVDSDEDVQELKDKIDMQEIKIDMLSEFLKVLYQRTFHIKNAIEFIKFNNGIA